MKLPAKYYPLKNIVQRPWYLPFLSRSEDVASTVGETVYVTNLKKWLKERPFGSPRAEAVLQHEKVHCYRQLQYGAKQWLVKYATDHLFREKEEKLAWFVQIKILQCHGLRVNVKSVAHSLSNYYPRLLDKQEAQSWVYKVLSNEWKPTIAELPADLQYLVVGC